MQRNNKKNTSVRVNVVLIGNPGVGKSTFLNMLLQLVKFKSGISIGKGLTTVCQKEVDDSGTVYIDTPGLSDIKLREQAAKEIKKALQEGGLFRIFFVITTEEGRIRPDDKATMKLVLDAAPIGTSYSVIVNKLQPEILQLLEDKEQVKEFITILNEDLPGTASIHFAQFKQSLSAKNNVLAPLDPEFLNFISNSPILQIEPAEVKDIKFSEFEEIKKLLSAQMELLKKDNEELQNRMKSQHGQYEKIIKEQKEQQERLQIQFHDDLEIIKQSHETKFANVKQEKSLGNLPGKLFKYCYLGVHELANLFQAFK